MANMLKRLRQERTKDVFELEDLKDRKSEDLNIEDLNVIFLKRNAKLIDQFDKLVNQ